MGGFCAVSYDLHNAAPHDYDRLNAELSRASFKKTEVNTFWTIALGVAEHVEKMFEDAARAAGIGRYSLVTMSLADPKVRVLRKPGSLVGGLTAARDAFAAGLKGGR